MRVKSSTAHTAIYFNVLYDLAFIGINVAVLWLLPYSVPAKMGLAAVLVCLIVISLYFFHNTRFPGMGVIVSLIFCGMGTVFILFGMILEPEWWTFTKLMFEGEAREVDARAAGAPGGDFPLYTGVGLMYCGFFGLIRSVLARLACITIERPKNNNRSPAIAAAIWG